MINRYLEKKIIYSLKHFPIVGILGSRQVGKTTLVKKIAKSINNSIYLDLELPSDISKLDEPEIFLNEYKNSLVILDEIQRLPELFPLLRALVDRSKKKGKFLILGSASPDLMKRSSESLAGRIIYHTLTPFNLFEIGSNVEKINKLWLRGGYPLSFLAANNKLSFEWRESFIQTFLERDIPQFGIRVPSIQLRRFWIMLSHSHGQIFNASKIANSLDITAPTVKHYLDILTDTFIVRQLPPFYSNVKKRLVKSSKIYIKDSGLLHALLNITYKEDLFSNPIIGHSWESFVIENIINQLEPPVIPYFYRTNAGAEIDLVLTKANIPYVSIEVKHSLSPKVSKSFRNAINDLNSKNNFIIYPGKETYSISKNVKALSVYEIGRIKWSRLGLK